MKIYFFLVIFLAHFPVYSESHHPQDFLKQIEGDKNQGQLIYDHFCINCHAQKPLISLGAPKIGDETDWKERLKKGLGGLFNNTNEGINAMPPRGGCFECSDKQLVLAILAMLPKSAQNGILKDLKDHKKYTK